MDSGFSGHNLIKLKAHELKAESSKDKDWYRLTFGLYSIWTLKVSLLGLLSAFSFELSALSYYPLSAFIAFSFEPSAFTFELFFLR
jgi:hypothetical protein